MMFGFPMLIFLWSIIRGTSTSGEEPGCAGFGDCRELREVFY